MISNTWFKHHPRKLWTWKSPGGRYKNQIDYITINKRFRNAVTQVKTYPGADCNTDHNPVVAEVKVRLKKHQNEKKKTIRVINILKENQSIKECSVIKTMNRYEVLMEMEGEDVQQLWTKLQTAVEEACDELHKMKRRKKKPWMTENILKLMDDRRKVKNIDEHRYQEIKKIIHKEWLLAKEEWMDENCTKIEQMAKCNAKEMYANINKTLCKKKRRNQNNTIMSKHGKI